MNQGSISPKSVWGDGVTEWNDAFHNCGRKGTCGSFKIDAEIAFVEGYG